VAKKLGVPVAHVEAGIRSGDWTMPEEINRVVTDAIADLFFTTSTFANENLQRAGVLEDHVFFVGNTMIDTLNANIGRITPPSFWDAMGLGPRNYLVATLHRPANVDDISELGKILAAIGEGACDRPVIFPVHPRTARTLRDLKNLPPNLRI